MWTWLGGQVTMLPAGTGSLASTKYTYPWTLPFFLLPSFFPSFMNLTLPGSFFVLFMLPAFVLVHVIVITFSCYGKTHAQINLEKSVLRLTVSEAESMAVVVRACSRQSGRFQSSNCGFSPFPRACIHRPPIYPYSPLHLLHGWLGLLKAQSPAPVKSFLQQGHTS